MLKHTQTYEIMTPESVGVSKTSLVMGKHSGRAAFRVKLKELGYELGENALEDAFNRFKALADRKKHVYDEDIEALVDEEIATQQDRVKVVALTVIAGTMGPQSATLTLDLGDGVHQTVQATATGRSKPLQRIIMCRKGKLASTRCTRDEGPRASRGVVRRRTRRRGQAVTRGGGPRPLVASAKDYVSALTTVRQARAAARAGQRVRQLSRIPSPLWGWLGWGIPKSCLGYTPLSLPHRGEGQRDVPRSNPLSGRDP